MTPPERPEVAALTGAVDDAIFGDESLPAGVSLGARVLERLNAKGYEIAPVRDVLTGHYPVTDGPIGSVLCACGRYQYDDWSFPEQGLPPDFWQHAVAPEPLRGALADFAKTIDALAFGSVFGREIRPTARELTIFQATAGYIKRLARQIAALEATAPSTPAHVHAPEYPSPCSGCEHLAADLAARLPEGLLPQRAAPSTPEPALDVAWAEAEAALPAGWDLMVGHTSECSSCEGWWATASRRLTDPPHYPRIISSETGRPRGEHHDGTPAAALRALVRRLTAALTSESRAAAPQEGEAK